MFFCFSVCLPLQPSKYLLHDYLAYETPPAGPMSCTGNTQWYVCSKGDFKGCCSSDPCKTGICPDSNSKSGSGSKSSSKQSTTTTPEHIAATSTAPTTSSSLDSNTLSSSSTISSTQSSTASSGSAAETGGDSMMMDMHDMDRGGMHKYHESLIAGVITGCVVAVLLLVGIILCMWYRSRKKTGKNFTLLQWCGACCRRNSGNGGHVKNRHNCHSACTCCNLPATTGEVNPTTPVSNSNVNNNANADISIDMGNTITTPGSSGTRFLPYSPPSAISSPERQNHPYQSITTAAVSPPQPLETIPSPTLVYQQNRDKRRRQRTTPELGDTGFYRPRVELATHSQSELINVPPRERTRRHHRNPRPNPNPNNGSSPGPGPSTRRDRARGQPEHIVTSDGVVLAANFSRLSPGARERDHATSFADVPLGLGFDFSCADRDIMRRADAVSEDNGQDGDVLPAYSESFNYEGKR